MTRFARYLGFHADTRHLGQVASGDPGIIIRRNPDTVLAPDVAFIRADRLPPLAQRRRFTDVIPDLVVEVVSPGESPGHVADKVRRYLEAGVQLVWLAYPVERRVVAHAPGQTAREYRVGDVLDGGEVFPGFAVAIADFFPD